MSYLVHDDHHDLQPCPKCGKSALAQPRHNVYRCLWCRFEVDISEANLQFSSYFFILALVVAVVIMLLG